MVNIIKFLQKWFYDIDKVTLCFAFVLMSLGLAMSLSVGPAIGNRLHISSYHFTIRHLLFLAIGLAVMLFCSMLSRKTILNMSYVGYICCFFTLIMVLFVGGSIKGSHRWVNLGFFALQPAEIMKPFFIVINAHFLSVARANKNIPIFSIVSFLFLLLLLVLEPDYGSSAIYCMIWFVQIVLGNSRLMVINLTIILLALSLGAIGFFFSQHFHYRILNFILMRGGHEQYQTKKALECIFNGGFFGKGLGEGEAKYQLPDLHTDYIFSVICEEFGAIFAMVLVMSILIFAYRHLVSNFLNKKYEIRVIYGLVLMFTAQSFIHMAVNINLIPSKGMTLPFISYGGSSMLSNAIIFGFLLAFTRKSYDYKSPYNCLKVFEYNVLIKR